MQNVTSLDHVAFSFEMTCSGCRNEFKLNMISQMTSVFNSNTK